MGLSRDTLVKWWHRYRAEGEAGLADRSSRPHRFPRRTYTMTENRVCPNCHAMLHQHPDKPCSVRNCGG